MVEMIAFFLSFLFFFNWSVRLQYFASLRPPQSTYVPIWSHLHVHKAQQPFGGKSPWLGRDEQIGFWQEKHKGFRPEKHKNCWLEKTIIGEKNTCSSYSGKIGYNSVYLPLGLAIHSGLSWSAFWCLKTLRVEALSLRNSEVDWERATGAPPFYSLLITS
jgi:hypothetical protein